MTNWRNYIHSDPDILLGKPVVKGTRLSVEFITGLFAAGWTQQQVLENYPTLTPESLRAVFAFATDCLREEALYTLPLEVVYEVSGQREFPLGECAPSSPGRP
jgi:uncharacterized protein (DUF433 family)